MKQEKIGMFIQNLRKDNNWTQEELAEKLGVNVKSISRWETGKNLPDHALIVEICKLFKISINEFYSGKKVKKSRKVLQIILFYLFASFTGIIILPVLGITAPTFILSGIIVPILGLVKLVAYIFGKDISFIMFSLGDVTLNPILGFFLSAIIGLIMIIAGIYMWRILIKYIHYIIDKKSKLYIDL